MCPSANSVETDDVVVGSNETTLRNVFTWCVHEHNVVLRVYSGPYIVSLSVYKRTHKQEQCRSKSWRRPGCAAAAW